MGRKKKEPEVQDNTEVIEEGNMIIIKKNGKIVTVKDK